MATYSLLAIIKHADISRIDLIHDHDPDGVSVHHWFDVHLEVPDNRHVQTMQMTVNYDPEWLLLEGFLTMHGWTVERDSVRNFHQGHGIRPHGEYR